MDTKLNNSNCNARTAANTIPLLVGVHCQRLFGLLYEGTLTMETERPTIEQLIEWEQEGGCEATDGCWVEPDGTCEHGCNSWLIEMCLI